MTPLVDPPLTLVAELTYRCPLGCVYCSNPVDARRHDAELDTETWARVLVEAEALGVLQVHFTGGEPLVRDDLETLVHTARALDLYTNLITSGIPLDESRLERLVRAGLDHVQLSFQGSREEDTTRFARHPGFSRKVDAARLIKAHGLALTINVVVHRENLDDVDAIVGLAEELSAERLELANAQYLGWALQNRRLLLPSRAQLDRARRSVAAARDRLLGKLEIDFVVPDYHVDRPRACMDGWGRRYLVVSPDGLVLPCHAAHTIPELEFYGVREHPVAEGWARAPGMQRFRGDDWMAEPCRSCERKHVDFGGCRCQAFHLTGHPEAVDPACELAPEHGLVVTARLDAEAPIPELVTLRYRRL